MRVYEVIAKKHVGNDPCTERIERIKEAEIIAESKEQAVKKMSKLYNLKDRVSEYQMIGSLYVLWEFEVRET